MEGKMNFRAMTIYEAVLKSMANHLPYCKPTAIAEDLGLSVSVVAAILENLQDKREVELHTTFNEQSLKSEYFWRLRGAY